MGQSQYTIEPPDSQYSIEPPEGGDLTQQTQAAAKQAGAPTSAPPPSSPLTRPAMPGTSSKYAGPQSVALPAKERASRDIPFDVAKVAGPSAALAVGPEVMLPGAIASGVARGASALTGATYGGRMSAEAGLPKWPGQVIGGVAGLLAPEVLNKMTGPLISKIATVLGKSTPEIASVLTEDSTLAQKVGRDVAERAARGAPLSPKEEELLLKQVQKYYTPETGIEQSAQKAGKIYAGRGTSLRPTNEQIAIRGMEPPPEPSPVTTGGSGESDASFESNQRIAAEKAGGVKYFRVTRGGKRIPWVGNDPGVARLNPGERMVRINTKTGEEFSL